MDNRFQVQFLRGEEWESVLQVETHLITEDTVSACPCAIFFKDAVVEHML